MNFYLQYFLAIIISPVDTFPTSTLSIISLTSTSPTSKLMIIKSQFTILIKNALQTWTILTIASPNIILEKTKNQFLY